MKVQRKLTDEEVDSVCVAKKALREIRKAMDTPGCFCATVTQLAQMVIHNTTDGQPYVDPEPPIPDGYRKATAGDEGRRDVKFWSPIASEWQDRPFPDASFTSGDQYIVPVDRVPTDDDAKSRPTIMVRDCSDMDWEKTKLVFVNSCADAVRKFVTVDSDSQCAYEWKQARHLYPGE